MLNAGLGISVISGAPIDVTGLDSHADTIFILPRGAGGRLPPLASCDLHLGAGRDLPHHTHVELSFDIFNMFNFQQVASVDSAYTADTVNPIPGGRVEDLQNLRTTAGVPVVRNPNFGQATSYQAPLSLRVGVRATF
jgi:hypothetical protein